MLLNYLYENFLEESAFAQKCRLTLAGLDELIEHRICPTASYVYDSRARSTSFVAEVEENATYRFHFREHRQWIAVLQRMGIDVEERARDLFFCRYRKSQELFLLSGLGQQMVAALPEIPDRFDVAHETMTWENFLKGVYGVCTRDGRPETVFIKQYCVMFIEAFTQSGPGSLADAELNLLSRVVSLLDEVASEFAPHEISQSSRQRCVIDVRKEYFRDPAA